MLAWTPEAGQRAGISRRVLETVRRLSRRGNRGKGGVDAGGGTTRWDQPACPGDGAITGRGRRRHGHMGRRWLCCVVDRLTVWRRRGHTGEDAV